MHERVKSFTFCVLAYNHEKYIIEHLESIKYLIEKHGAGMEFQVIVNDDCSKDRTPLLVDSWLKKNSKLFIDVVKIYNKNNIGTCSSLKNILEYLKSDYCKITAGDDIYSFEDIFMSVTKFGCNDILSGAPLSLVDGNLSLNRTDVFNVIASDIIYKKDALIDRFKGISVNNAPNIIYRKEYLKNKNIVDFFSKYDVVEDWPLQIAIAENKNSSTFYLDNTVFVYYRRTAGSTFIVASNRFVKDQVNIFKYLIENEESLIKKLVLQNRLLCFLSGSKFVKRFLNLALWIYAVRVVVNARSIFQRTNDFNIDISKHRIHCQDIQSKSQQFLVKSSFHDLCT